MAAAPAAAKLANLLAKRPEAAPHVSAAARAALKQVQREAASAGQGGGQATTNATAASAGPTSLQASANSVPKRKAGGITADVSAGVVSLGSLVGLPRPPKTAATSGPGKAKAGSGGSGGILSLGPETPAEAMRRQQRAGRFEAEEKALSEGPEFVAPPPPPQRQQPQPRSKNSNAATSNRKRALNPLQCATTAKKGRNQASTSGAPTPANTNQSQAEGGGGGDEEEESEWAKTAVVGTCLKLEKSYLRLTSAPRPELVRPEPVLEQALTHVQARWRDAEEQYHNSSTHHNNGDRSDGGDDEGDDSRLLLRNKAAAWCDDQLKAIRQDMVHASIIH